MKKIAVSVLILLLMIGLFAGCGNSELESTEPDVATDNRSVQALSSNVIYAEVSGIVDNQLTLKVLQGSFDPEQMVQRMGDRPTGDFTRPEGEGFSMPDGSDMPARGERPQGERPQSNPPQGERPQGERPQGGEPMTNEAGEPLTMPAAGNRYTGEEKDVVIPIDTPVKSYTMTAGELKEDVASVDDIQNGSIINIVYNNDGSMEKVQIINMGEFGAGNSPGFPGGMMPPMG